MYAVKNPEMDLKLQYRKVFEVALIISLITMIMVFRISARFMTNRTASVTRAIEIHVQDIPKTEQLHNRPLPPARPAIPVPTEDETIPEDFTIESTELNLELATVPPPPPREEDEFEHYAFIAYDAAPVLIGGYQAIREHLKYPELARLAGMEATVIIAVLIDKNGNSVKTEVLKAAGSCLGFEEAAQKAVMKVKWKPAMQRDMPVKVWMSIPINFKLNTAT
jgi:protein TonB